MIFRVLLRLLLLFLLLLENKNLQMEFGAKFDGECEFKINNRFFNLSCFSAVCANYSASDINYTGWWYCCIPSCIVTEKNLPMPYFIHLDDIEYGMRNYNNGIILLNGISVWHPSFVNKSPLWYGYYDMRNQLLTCSMTDYFNAMTLYSAYFKNKSFWDVIDMMIFRHQTFVWLLHIMKCFCKGPETLLNLDALDRKSVV